MLQNPDMLQQIMASSPELANNPEAMGTLRNIPSSLPCSHYACLQPCCATLSFFVRSLTLLPSHKWPAGMPVTTAALDLYSACFATTPVVD
jgi:hypothetical protein